MGTLPSNCDGVLAASLASAEDALLAGALVSSAKADQKPRLFVFLLLLQTIIRLSF